MVSVLLLLVATLSFDWAKSCKPINFKYTQFKNKEKYGYGCKKGCVGYANDSNGVISVRGTKFDGDHTVQDSCVECKTMTKDLLEKIMKDYFSSWGSGYTFSYPDINDEFMEQVCNSVKSSAQVNYMTSTGGSGSSSVNFPSPRGTCFWNSKKKTCGAGSCPHQAAVANCWKWKNGKCEKINYDECSVSQYLSGSYYEISGSGSCSSNCDNKCYSQVQSSSLSCNNVTNYYQYLGYDNAKSCIVYKKVTADLQNECKYRCEHKQASDTSYEYSKGSRKQCNKLLGCMYGGITSASGCSHLAIWAFVVILVIAILVVVAIIAVVCFLIFKLCCGNKSPKVDPAADKAAPVSKAAPATQDPPPEVGPYVVIKLGKQESKTKKVESAVWGQTIVFTGLGAEDDDVLFELHDNSDALLGSADVRIPDYVNAKKRATINLKNGEADIGVLEVDIEIQVQEEPEVKITGVFFVDKFTKA